MKNSLGVKMLLFAVCVLISLVVALVASWIEHSSGASLSDVVDVGGDAFATAVLVCMAVVGTYKML